MSKFKYIAAGVLSFNLSGVLHAETGQTQSPPAVPVANTEAPALHKLEAYEKSFEIESSYSRTLGVFFGAIAQNTKQRGTHSKGICSNANFKIESGIIQDEAVKKFLSENALFSQQGKSFSTRVRFADAKTFSGEKIKDTDTMDPKAISLVVNYGENKRQDFILQNIPTFPFKNLKTFVALMTFRAVELGDEKTETPESLVKKYNAITTLALQINQSLGMGLEEKDLPHQVNDDRINYNLVKSTIEKVKGKIYSKLGYSGVGSLYLGLLWDLYKVQSGVEDSFKFTASPVLSYLQQVYWSGTAFAMGESNAMKYILKPCAVNQINDSFYTSQDPDYLIKEFKDQVAAKKNSCLELHIQPLPLNLPQFDLTNPSGDGLKKAQEHVENPMIVWDESWPTYKVATIDFTGSSLLSEEECNGKNSAINVNDNTLNDIRPLGRLNRGRKIPEQASAQKRLNK